jgi:acetyl-CoA carboxylase carboxyltransferase component
MSSKQMRNDLAYAWPTAQIAVMGAEGAVRILYRQELAKAADLGQIDEVIEPRETRPRLIRALEVLRTKVQQNPTKKHGLMPL